MTGPEYREIARINEQLTNSIEMLQQRVDELETSRAPILLPHVVLGPGDVLVLTGPDDMDSAQLVELQASVAAMNLHGRVILVAPELRTAIHPPREAGIEPPLSARPALTHCPVCGTSTEYHDPSDHAPDLLELPS